jgi:hypothetical protein
MVWMFPSANKKENKRALPLARLFFLGKNDIFCPHNLEKNAFYLYSFVVK